LPPLNTHSKAFMQTQSHSGFVQYSLKVNHAHSLPFSCLYNHSKVFTRTQLYSGHVQYQLKGIHVHSIMVSHGQSIHTHSMGSNQLLHFSIWLITQIMTTASTRQNAHFQLLHLLNHSHSANYFHVA